MRKKQPKAYRLEFREEALRRVQDGSTPIRALAEELGVHVETLRNWRRDARAAGPPHAAAHRAHHREPQDRQFRGHRHRCGHHGGARWGHTVENDVRDARYTLRRCGRVTGRALR